MWSGRLQHGMFAEAAIVWGSKELAARHATGRAGWELDDGWFAQSSVDGLVCQ